MTPDGSDPLTSTKDCRKKWEKRDQEEATAEKEATLGAAEEAVVEVMAEAEEGEAMVEAAGEEAAEGMIVDTTAGRTETADQHQSKKVRKSTSP